MTETASAEMLAKERTVDLVATPLLPEGHYVPASRWTHPSLRLRDLLATEPYVFAPGVFDPHGAELAMYHGCPSVYLSGYSFAMGHLGTTDMDLYSSVEIADAARRTVSALRKFQLTQALGDPEHGVAPRHLEIPPVLADMDTGYGNAFNVMRTAELYVTAGVAACHLEDQVMPKRCGHIGGKALVPAEEFVGKLRMARAVADDLGNPDFVIVARTDALSAVDAPESKRGMALAVERSLRYLDSGIPDLVWCEFPTAERGPLEEYVAAVRKRFPAAEFAFNYSSSFKWFNEAEPLSFRELGALGCRYIFITLAAQHAMGYGFTKLLAALGEDEERAYHALQRDEWGADDVPTRSHHVFSGVPYHHAIGKRYGGTRFGGELETVDRDRAV